MEFSDFAIGALAGAMYVAPSILGITPGSPAGLPWDPATIPAFDRWVVAPPRDFWVGGSYVALLGLTAATWWELTRGRQDRFRVWAASAESAALAVGVTQFLKRSIGRARPVLYTAEALTLADPAAERRAWPSSHSATASALATSLFLTKLREGDDLGPAWFAVAGAVSVGAMRLAAAKHFPSDVLGGLAVGALSALIVHSIQF